MSVFSIDKKVHIDNLVFSFPNKLSQNGLAWVEHIPFAYFLVNYFKPLIITELGVHGGNSYNAFCRAVFENKLETKCYGIDTWEGDDHAGFYGDDIYTEVLSYQKQNNFESFSILLRKTFNDALLDFEDKSIDLLHIDGLHTYEAVKQDFESWLPKMSSRSIILFHDTQVKKDDFGVWEFWQEIQNKYPSIEFKHGHGLGILATGDDIKKSFKKLKKYSKQLESFFAILGSKIVSKFEFTNTTKVANLVLFKEQSISSVLTTNIEEGNHQINFLITEDGITKIKFVPSDQFSFFRLNRVILNYNKTFDVLEAEKTKCLVEHGTEFIVDENGFFIFNIERYSNLESITFDIQYNIFGKKALTHIPQLGLTINQWFYNQIQSEQNSKEDINLQLQKATTQLSNLQAQIKSLDEEINQKNVTLEREQNINKSFASDLLKTKETVEQKKILLLETNTSISSLQAQIKSLDEEINQKDTMLENEKKVSDKLSHDLSIIKDENMQQKSVLNKILLDLETTQQKNEKNLHKLDTQNQQILEKDRLLHQKKLELEQQEFFISEYKKQIEQSHHKIISFEKKIESLQGSSIERQNNIAAQDKEIEYLRATIQSLNSNLDKLSNKEQELLSKKNSINTISTEQQIKINAQDKEIEVLRNNIESLKTNVEELNNKRKELLSKTHLAETQQKESQIKQLEIDQLRLTIQSLEEKNAAANELFQGFFAELENNEAVISEKVTKINEIQQKVQSLNQKLSQKDFFAKEKLQELTYSRNQITQISAENQDKHTKIALQEAQINTIKSLLQSSEELIHNQHHEINQLQQSILELDKNYSDLRGSLSFKTGWTATAPFRWLYNLINKDKPVNQSKLWMWMQFLSSSVSQPGAFIKQINAGNIQTLRKALTNESPELIVGNLKKLLSGENRSTSKGNPVLEITSEVKREEEFNTIQSIEPTVSINSHYPRPKILYISPNLPDYDTSSGGKRATRMLELLAQDCDVYAFTRGATPDKHIKKLSEVGVIVLRTTDYNQIRRRIHHIDTIIYAWYYTYFDSNRFTQLYPDAKIIVDSVDVHWVREARSIGIWEGLTEEMVEKNKKREVEAYKNADIVWTVTENDKNAVLEEIPTADIRVVSNIHSHAKAAYEDSNNNNLLFIGGFNHYPNISAVKLLANEIIPNIRKQIPDATLTIAGANASEEIQALGKLPGIIFKGFIEEEDMDSLYQNTFATISPLLAGAGIKGKICESISYMTPVITNGIGNEGIDLENIKDGLITDDYNEMANLAARALKREFDFHAMTQSAQEKLHHLVGPEMVKSRMLSSILPEVSICIVTWNRLELLKRCIESIEGNTNYPYYKILVHSNGCEDGTQAYLEAASKINKRIIPILSKTNDVFVIPNNKMMMLYPDNDVLLLNNDTYVTPNWLTGLYKAAYSSSEIGIAGSKIMYPDGRLQEFGSELYENGSGRNIGKWDEEPNKPEYSKQTAVGYVSGCSMYIKRSTIKQIGVFDEQFHPCYCEDSDLCYTAWEHNIQTVVTPQSVIYHDEGGTSGTDTSKGFKRYQEVNFKKFLEKHKANLKDINAKINSIN